MEFISFILLLSIIIGIPFLGLFLLGRWTFRKGYKFATLTLAGIGFFLGYFIYTAVYPADSFYLEEFKEVTFRDAPASVEIIKKDATYPDFHGDYVSCSLIKLSKSDYAWLLNQLINDRRFKKGELIGSESFDKVVGDKFNSQKIKHQFNRVKENEIDHYLYIGFLDDRQTIVVYICVT